MKVKFGAIVVDGRNKIGGHVMSKNRAGAYMRTKVTPVNPSSQYQNAVRARLTTLSQAWKALTAAEVLAWNYAVEIWKSTDIFGDIHKPSGINLFQRLNNNKVRGSGNLVTAPPVPVAVSDLGSLSVAVVDASSVTYTVTLQTLGVDEVLEVLASAPVGAGINFGKNLLRIIKSDAALTAGVYVATTPYVAMFGVVPSAPFNAFFGARVINKETGQTSGLYTFTLRTT
jgi:hypothetical protein